MVRELAAYQPDRVRRVLRWPLREALLAYVDLMKSDAITAHRHAELVWACIAPHSTKKVEPPKKPPILRGPYASNTTTH